MKKTYFQAVIQFPSFIFFALMLQLCQDFDSLYVSYTFI